MRQPSRQSHLALSGIGLHDNLGALAHPVQQDQQRTQPKATGGMAMNPAECASRKEDFANLLKSWVDLLHQVLDHGIAELDDEGIQQGTQ